MKELINRKYSSMQLMLTVVFAVCFIVSNIIASKQVQLPLGIITTGGIVIFPVTYILSDIFSEIYGYKYSRVTNYIGLLLNLFTVGIFSITIVLNSPEFYTNSNAYAAILGNTPRMLVASTIGLWAGDFVNDNVFKLMKKKYQNSTKGYGVRSIVSSLFGELADSCFFIPIAFYGLMPSKVMVVMIFTQAALKIAYEILLLPISVLIMKKVAAFEKTII